MKNFSPAVALAAAFLCFQISVARAEIGYALTGTSLAAPQGGLVQFNTASPGSAVTVLPITNTGGEQVLDIDFFPVNGQLFGIVASGRLYQLNTLTGAATLDVIPQTPFANTPYAIDFNPAADRLRVISTDLTGTNDQNARLTPSISTAGSTGTNAGQVTLDGTLSYAAGDPAFGLSPRLVAAAYNNNFDGTASTALYSLDSTVNSLVLHTGSPAFSTLTTAGTLFLSGSFFDLGDTAGFDISPTTIGYISNGNALYSTTSVGTAVSGSIPLTSLGTIGTGAFAVKSIAIVPEPSAAVLLLGGLAALLASKRRSDDS